MENIRSEKEITSLEEIERMYKERRGMYKVPTFAKTTALINQSVQGETIENKIDRILNNKEPIKDGAPIIYTKRSEGIKASTNIRTDRFEIAIEATDKIAKSYKAKREERAKAQDGEPKPIQGKSDGDTAETTK